MNGLDTQFFFNSDDERAFSVAVRRVYPQTVFLDWMREFDPKPEFRLSIEECQTARVMVLNREIFPIWPKSAGAERLGPGFLVFYKSRRMELVIDSGAKVEALVSGSLGWGGEPRADKYAEMLEFAKAGMQLVESMHTEMLIPFERRQDSVGMYGVRGYTIGPGAADWCRGHEDRVLKVNAGRHIYTCVAPNSIL